MRVLALSHVFPRSAADPSAPFLLRWAGALQHAGARVVVVAPHDAGLPGRHRVGGVAVRRARYAPDRWERIAYRGRMHELVRTPAGPPLLVSLVAALAVAVRAQVRAADPDVLHVHWWLPGAVAARLAASGLPTVVTVHGTDVALLEARPALAGLARWALAAADRVEAVSTDLAERLERATGRRVDAVGPMPLGALPVALPSAGNGPLRVLAVGRLVADKGFADLVAAVARLDVPARLTIVGDGPEHAALRAQASTLRVDLDLPGRLAPDELIKAYADADVVAQPSRREGLGMVAAEALAAGIPVVATDSGGVRDLIPHHDLIAPGDIPALTAALATARAPTPAQIAAVRDRLSPAAVAARTLAGYRTVM